MNRRDFCKRPMNPSMPSQPGKPHSDGVKETTPEQKNAARRKYWGERIAEQERSGLSVHRFCGQQRLTEPSFYAWRKRLRNDQPMRLALVETEPAQRQFHTSGSRTGVGDGRAAANLDAVAYEALMLGIFGIFNRPPNELSEKTGIPEDYRSGTWVRRDGITWKRPNGSSFLACSQKAGTWNRGYLHSTGGVCLVVGDELRFYFGAFSGISPRLGRHMYAAGSTGLATLRRDGFASMDPRSQAGTLTTRPVVFSGSYLFVNANARNGQLRAELLTQDGAVIAPFHHDNCQALRADKTCHRMSWNGIADLAKLRGRVRSAGRALRREVRFENGAVMSTCERSVLGPIHLAQTSRSYAGKEILCLTRRKPCGF